MGLSEGQKSVVADTNNSDAARGWHPDYRWTKQCRVTIYICVVLNRYFARPLRRSLTEELDMLIALLLVNIGHH